MQLLHCEAMTISNTTSEQIATRPRVLSGMRPTGRLHLGNYMGALYNWVQLQHQYECYFFVADYHALTTEYADPSRLKQNVFDITLDFLAAGLDPEKCTIFVQSHVPEHAELHLQLSMITPLSWLERVPTYKDQQEQLKEKDLATYGFLGYPLLQSADILLYTPHYVPVGQDQVAHVEITREIARRFNFLYGTKGNHSVKPYQRLVEETGSQLAASLSPKGESLPMTTFTDANLGEMLDASREILPEPQVLLTPSPKLPGIDGRKMSKSYGNTIGMADPGPVVMQKAMSMSNGGQRPTQSDPGDPEVCPVGDLHRIFSEPAVDAHIRKGCVSASIRCDECKNLLGASIARHTQPIFNRRRELESNPDYVWKVLEEGAARARKRAEETMQEVRGVTGLSRDRSGVRVVDPMFSSGAKRDLHDLTSFKDWWGLEPAVLTRNLREQWLKDVVPHDVVLKQDSDGVLLTWNAKRVLLATATQTPGDEAWTFSVKPKSYEILVLLCWDEEFRLHDFVIPQKLYVGPWTVAKKAAGKDPLVFSVAREEGKFALHLPRADAAGIDITETEARYRILGN
jgi:tryptophanyl-tRNA synthetase